MYMCTDSSEYELEFLWTTMNCMTLIVTSENYKVIFITGSSPPHHSHIFSYPFDVLHHLIDKWSVDLQLLSMEKIFYQQSNKVTTMELNPLYSVPSSGQTRTQTYHYSCPNTYSSVTFLSLDLASLIFSCLFLSIFFLRSFFSL